MHHATTDPHPLTGRRFKRALLFMVAMLCALWIQGYAENGTAWTVTDSELLKQLAMAGDADRIMEIAGANRIVITERWLHMAGARASALESNYTSDIGLRMTRALEEIARRNNMTDAIAAVLYERGTIFLDYQYRYNDARAAYSSALAASRTSGSSIWQARCVNRL
ncbi:MAG: hypothetical protein JXA07_14825, partial [Spirochaetes bacterium]|nr:hypothetical protein [Spirochaetota bacterium]